MTEEWITLHNVELHCLCD